MRKMRFRDPLLIRVQKRVLDLISLCTSDTFAKALKVKRKRELPSVEALTSIVSRGIRDGWVRPKPLGPGEEHMFRRRFTAQLAMDCENPYEYSLFARYNMKCEMVRAIMLDLTTRCRKCQACRDRKAMYWTGRAIDEFQWSPATYMATLTLRPEMHYFFDAQMSVPFVRRGKLVRDAIQADRLSDSDLFRHRTQEIGREITTYFKRLRKYGASYRYLLVAEAHEGSPGSAVYGRPHFHVLFHETEIGTLVHGEHCQVVPGYCHRCKRMHVTGEVCDDAMVRKTWPHGFTKVVRCVDAASAGYLCKYVSKSMVSRVRASIDYGVQPEHRKHNLGLIVSSEGANEEEGKLTPQNP